MDNLYRVTLKAKETGVQSTVTLVAESEVAAYKTVEEGHSDSSIVDVEQIGGPDAAREFVTFMDSLGDDDSAVARLQDEMAVAEAESIMQGRHYVVAVRQEEGWSAQLFRFLADANAYVESLDDGDTDWWVIAEVPTGRMTEKRGGTFTFGRASELPRSVVELIVQVATESGVSVSAQDLLGRNEDVPSYIVVSGHQSLGWNFNYFDSLDGAADFVNEGFKASDGKKCVDVYAIDVQARKAMCLSTAHDLRAGRWGDLSLLPITQTDLMFGLSEEAYGAIFGAPTKDRDDEEVAVPEVSRDQLSYDDFDDAVAHWEFLLKCSRCGREEWREAPDRDRGGTAMFEEEGWVKLKGRVLCNICQGDFRWALERHDGKVELVGPDHFGARIAYAAPFESLYKSGMAAYCAAQFVLDHAERFDPLLIREFFMQIEVPPKTPPQPGG